MGLKDDLIDAKLAALKIDAKVAGATEEEITNIVPSESIKEEVELTAEAIINFLTKADFRVTQLKAPIILEDFKIPDQAVNVELETLLGDKKPILDSIKKIGELIPGAGAAIEALVDRLEVALEQAIKPLLEGGSTLPGPNVSKEDGALESTGYVYVGDDPESQSVFDVGDEDGQRQFTTVKLIREDIEEIL